VPLLNKFELVIIYHLPLPSRQICFPTSKILNILSVFTVFQILCLPLIFHCQQCLLIMGFGCFCVVFRFTCLFLASFSFQRVSAFRTPFCLLFVIASNKFK
jgi:hypothetical protein